MKDKITYLLQLIRWPVSLAVTFSAFTGAMLAIEPGQFNLLLLALVGVFLLAGGSSALNQWQERKQDALMKRTEKRPLPSGHLSSAIALFWSLVLIATGSLILWHISVTTFAVGIFTLLWYNGLYTPLKLRWAFAVVPGALTGATPALIGYTALGGGLWDTPGILLAGVIFLWQVPHFWLLLIRYDNQYRQAGFKSIVPLYNNQQIRHLIYTWILATSMASLLFPLFGIIQHPLLVSVLFLLNGTLILLFYKQLFAAKPVPYKRVRIYIHLFLTLFCLLIIGQQALAF